jgi:pilus assembly protein CpaE
MPGLEIIGAPTEVAPRRGVRAEDLRPVLAFVRAYYDWILVDLGRGLNRVAAAVLEEVDETFLVTTLDVPALHQTQRIVRSLMETGYGEPGSQAIGHHDRGTREDAWNPGLRRST